jgi:hypothetical protein
MASLFASNPQERHLKSLPLVVTFSKRQSGQLLDILYSLFSSSDTRLVGTGLERPYSSKFSVDNQPFISESPFINEA